MSRNPGSLARASPTTAVRALTASAAARSVTPVAPTLEEVVYDLAREALDEQREVVASLRSRAAPVLAGAGALAALLAKPAIGDGLSFAQHPAHAALVCVGILGAVGALLGAILVLATPRLRLQRRRRAPLRGRLPRSPRTRGLPPAHRRVTPPTASAEPRRRPCLATLPRRRPARSRPRGHWLRDRPRRTLTSWLPRLKARRSPPRPRHPQHSRPRPSHIPTSSSLRARRSVRPAKPAPASTVRESGRGTAFSPVPAPGRPAGRPASGGKRPKNPGVEAPNRVSHSRAPAGYAAARRPAMP